MPDLTHDEICDAGRITYQRVSSDTWVATFTPAVRSPEWSVVMSSGATTRAAIAALVAKVNHYRALYERSMSRYRAAQDASLGLETE